MSAPRPAARPTKLELTRRGDLRIQWSDGAIREYPVRELRDQCPCATCREKRATAPLSPLQLPVLTPAETQPLRITKMEPAGHYAYAIHFSDGHDTGLFTLEALHMLGRLADDD